MASALLKINRFDIRRFFKRSTKQFLPQLISATFFALITIAALTYSTPVYAPTPSLTIAQTTQMDFATLVKPSSGSEYIDIAADGSGASGTGTIVTGTISRGAYKITHEHGTGGTISLDIGNISSGNAAITLDSFNGIYNGTTISSFPQGGLAQPANGNSGTVLYVGARSTYTSAVPEGAVVASFDIIAIFE